MLNFYQLFFKTKPSSPFQSQNNIDTLFISIFEMFCSIIVLFVTCELGDQISMEFDEINDQINEFNWYLCPLNVQKMLPAMMMNLQQPVDFKCFGSSACNRSTFKEVSQYDTDSCVVKLKEWLNGFYFSGGEMCILIFYDTPCIFIRIDWLRCLPGNSKWILNSNDCMNVWI